MIYRLKNANLFKVEVKNHAYFFIISFTYSLTNMMRHALPFEVDKISQWKFFYYNHSLLADLIQILENLSLIRDHLRVLVMSNSPLGNQHLIIYYRQHNLVEIVDFMHEVNSIFFQFKKHEMEATYVFSQMKSQELARKADFYVKITETCERGMDDCLILLENTYIQNQFLHRLVEFSMEKEELIMNMHKSISKRYQDFDTPSIDDKRISRLKSKIKNVNEHMKKQYSLKWAGEKQQHEEDRKKTAVNQLKNIVRNQNQVDFQTIISESLLKFLLGLLGFAFIVLIYLIISYDIQISSDETFEDMFPLWRGLSYFIVYNWVLAFNTLIFEKHHINYRKILNLERNRIPKTSFLFFSATIFSIIYLILFIMFILKLRGIAQFTSFRLDMFPAVGWMVFIGLIFYPFGFTYYFLNIFCLMLISPFIGVNFTSNWLSEQLSSFKQPFHDISFTILYYLQDNQTVDESWEEARYIGAWIGTYIYLLRMSQGLRKGIAMGKYFVGVPLFRGCLKCVFNILTIWTAYFYRYNDEDQSVLVYWIISGTFSTIYAYAYDIHFDWNLIQNPCFSGQRVMRKRRILGGGSKKLYAFFVFINFFLRIAWLFTISTDFVIATFTYPHVFILVVSILEIIRRGIWNLLFIEKEHVAHCENFDCMVNDTSFQNNTIKEYEKNSSNEEEKMERQKQIEAFKKDKSYEDKKIIQLEAVKRMIKRKEENDEFAKNYIKNSKQRIKQIREELGIALKGS